MCCGPSCPHRLVIAVRLWCSETPLSWLLGDREEGVFCTLESWKLISLWNKIVYQIQALNLHDFELLLYPSVCLAVEASCPGAWLPPPWVPVLTCCPVSWLKTHPRGREPQPLNPAETSSLVLAIQGCCHSVSGSGQDIFTHTVEHRCTIPVWSDVR